MATPNPGAHFAKSLRSQDQAWRRGQDDFALHQTVGRGRTVRGASFIARFMAGALSLKVGVPRAVKEGVTLCSLLSSLVMNGKLQWG